MPPLSHPTLADDVVRLRAWRAEDADAQLAAFTDPLFVRFSDWAPSGRAEVVDRIAAVERVRVAGRGIHLAITPADGDDLVLGEVSLAGVDSDQGRASVGYWLTAAARGRGAAARAVRLVAGWAFTDLGLARLEITCGPDNTGSQRVATRCGFQQEGLLRSHLRFKGGRRDSLLFGLLPADRPPPARHGDGNP